MTRAGDPAWVTAARALHSLSLHCYPRSLREAHGEEMRQAFRDRCREAVARGDGPLRLLLREWLPDLARGASEAHLAQPAFASDPRQAWSLGLLCLALSCLLMQDRLSRFALDHFLELRGEWRQARYLGSLEGSEAKVRRLAASLADAPSAEDRALAAYLFGALHHGRVFGADAIDRDFTATDSTAPVATLEADGRRASALVGELMREPLQAAGLVAALNGCDHDQGDCDRGAIIRRLQDLDPNNGFAWSLAFSDARQRGDERAMAAAVKAMARTTRYDSYQAPINARLFAVGKHFDPDPASLANLAWALDRESGPHYQDWLMVALACSPHARFAGSPPHWVDLHPEHAPDCARIAALLTGSTDVRPAKLAWRDAYFAATGATSRDSAQARCSSRDASAFR